MKITITIIIIILLGSAVGIGTGDDSTSKEEVGTGDDTTSKEDVTIRELVRLYVDEGRRCVVTLGCISIKIK